jgi:CRP-like cAMP-binding protein/thioredoxin reductase/Pyruvate/2-oxoacid:ferredoxin oxidoreductase delta subunit
VTDTVRIAIVGSGPAGLSCAARAAHHGLSHVLLEAEAQPSNTIFRYQKGKHVMAEPAVLPLRSALSFAPGRREAVLAKWREEIEHYKINVRYRAPVTRITGTKGAFELATARGETVRAEHVVLCIGVQGNLRRLDVPGDDLPQVQYQLDDPEEYRDEVIVVVGAGDAAIENALALAANNRVILINRSGEFARAKQGNLEAVTAAIGEGRIDCRHHAAALRIEQVPDGGKPICFVAQTAQGEERLLCDRVIARLGASPPRRLVEGFGVQFPSADADAVPRLSVTYESNVPGLYIIGALAGYPLIKQCMNQGYEVVEYILGNPVKPADEELLKKKLVSFPRDGGVSRALALVQSRVNLLAGMSTLQLREFMLESEVRAPKKGELLFRKGDYSNSFYCILEGEVLIEITEKDGVKDERVMRRGEFFGELGLLSGRRRSSTARAGDGCVLIESPRRSMLRLLGTVESVRRKIDQTSLRRAVRAYVAPSVSDTDLDEMVKDAVVKRFAASETLFKEGDAADGLHLIRRGSVMVSRIIGGKEIVLSYVAAGNYVGEMALLSDAPRSATVRASVPTETIVLPMAAFRAVLERNTAMRGGMEARVLQRIAQNADREARPDAGNLVSFLMSQGLGEATDVLLIDESLCVRCDHCERACADTHGGTSRLDRQAGPTFANIHVPTSCRHCENPRCMKDCPPDAIHRNPNGEIFIQDTCIGCGNCERNCPYGVIQLAPADPKGSWSSLWAWLLLGVSTEPGRQRIKADADQQKKAVKCDMCKDLSGGPACVRACPTGAAIRVSPERFLDYTAN